MDAVDREESFPCRKESDTRVHDYSVWPIRSGRFGLSCFGLSRFGLSRFGLAVSVTGHFGRDISVHKELMKLVKFVNVNEYLGMIIIYPYNTRQIKTRQFAVEF